MKLVRFAPMTVLLLAAATSVLAAADQQPNVIVLFADDLGYGELIRRRQLRIQERELRRQVDMHQPRPVNQSGPGKAGKRSLRNNHRHLRIRTEEGLALCWHG